MKIKLLIVLLAIMITACAPAAEPTQEPTDIPPDTAVTSPPVSEITPGEPMKNPLAPQPGDAAWERGAVFIDESELLIRESYPPQISLTISGNLPTPCHQLRVQVSEPDVENKINVEAYTVVDPNMMCTQVLKPYTESVLLVTPPTGHYSVWVNGQSVGEFDS